MGGVIENASIQSYGTWSLRLNLPAMHTHAMQAGASAPFYILWVLLILFILIQLIGTATSRILIIKSNVFRDPDETSGFSCRFPEVRKIVVACWGRKNEKNLY